MNDKNPDEKNGKREGLASVWPVLISIGTIIILSLVAQEVEKESPGSGRKVFGWFFGIGALLVFLNIIWSSTLKGIGQNMLSVIKAIAGFLIAAFVLAGIGKGCSSGSDIEPATENAFPDNIRR